MGRSILARMAAGWKYDNFQIRISSTNLKPALNASPYPSAILTYARLYRTTCQRDQVKLDTIFSLGWVGDIVYKKIK